MLAVVATRIRSLCVTLTYLPLFCPPKREYHTSHFQGEILFVHMPFVSIIIIIILLLVSSLHQRQLPAMG